jgi:hypothetical protein
MCLLLFVHQDCGGPVQGESAKLVVGRPCCIGGLVVWVGRWLGPTTARATSPPLPPDTLFLTCAPMNIFLFSMLVNPAAQSPCSPGSYLVGQTCTICLVGNYCKDDSMFPCPVGQYCPTGNLSIFVPCPAGKYGSVEQLTTPECSGNCTAGYFCSQGSSSPSGQACGTFCASCSKPPPLRPPAFARAPPPHSSCSWGALHAEVCAEVSESESVSVLCLGLARGSGPGNFCPAGTPSRRPVQPGFFGSGSAVNGSNLYFTTQTECPAGSYCEGDSYEAVLCPPGRYGAENAASVPSSHPSLPCPPPPLLPPSPSRSRRPGSTWSLLPTIRESAPRFPLLHTALVWACVARVPRRQLWLHGALEQLRLLGALLAGPLLHHRLVEQHAVSVWRREPVLSQRVFGCFYGACGFLLPS